MKPIPSVVLKTNDAMVYEYIAQASYDVNDIIVVNNVRIAIDYYLNNNVPVLSKDEIFSHINGIDFNNPVEVVLLEEDDLLDQIQVSVHGSCISRKGNYYALHDQKNPITPSARGISDETIDSVKTELVPGVTSSVKDEYFYSRPKKLTVYAISKAIKSLKSTSKPIHDHWSMKISRTHKQTCQDDIDGSIKVNTKGGGTQFYIGKLMQEYVLCKHELEYKTLIGYLKTDLSFVKIFDEDHFETLSNQIVILRAKAQYAASIKDIETHKQIKRELTDLLELIISAQSRIKIEPKFLDKIKTSLVQIISAFTPATPRARAALARSATPLSEADSTLTTRPASATVQALTPCFSSSRDSFSQVTPADSQGSSITPSMLKRRSSIESLSSSFASLDDLSDLINQAKDSLPTPSPKR